MLADAKNGWVDDVGDDQLRALLTEHGTDVNRLVARRAPDAESATDGYQIVPLRPGWLRISLDALGRLSGRWLQDPGRPEDVDDGPTLYFEETGATDLDGWIQTRADLDGAGRRWLCVLRRPEREAYTALVYDAAEHGPVRRRVISGVYPDITLCDEDATRVVFVEPDRSVRGLTRAVLAPVGDGFDTARTVLRDSTNGGLGLRACAVRRFVKLSSGVRTLRLWDLVDVAATFPGPITVPGAPTDPDLFDVALLDGAAVLAQAVNVGEHWELVVSVIEDGEILHGWRAATGPGTALEVASGDGCALVRVQDGVEQSLVRVDLAGFSTAGTAVLQSSAGLFSLSVNTAAPAVGFGAVELIGGSEPYTWFWGPDGTVLNPSVDLAQRASSRPQRRVERVVSEDGFTFALDVRWRGEPGQPFRGPVLLMVYGAYGMDVDLDTDRDLGRWLDRGFAVGTPHVRGGGPGPRHLAGCRANRDRSLADVRAAVRWLRAGGGDVTATSLCVLGASAGGFLAATTLNTCPDDVDACVIVNGFVDPLTSLLSQDTPTPASDQDEWGNPLANAHDLETLRAVSPVHNLRPAGAARALVVISARDVRVNPRQGLKWFLGYRGLGGDATLWFDPNGAHDCWGAGMDPEALVDWVCDALGLPV